MPHDKLVKPNKGFFFNIGYLLFNFVWAKTLVWADDKGDDRTYKFISLHAVVRKEEENKSTLVSLILGPLKITVGW